jgi:transposase
MKTDLNLRPIFHQKEKRINAHLFITVLAYHVMHTIRYKLRQHGLHFSWETIRKNMSTQVRVTTSVKTQEGKQLHIRATTQPEPFHKKIFRALNIYPLLKSRKTLA